MKTVSTQQLTIGMPNDASVSARSYPAAAGARACYVLAHGAGAGMTHPSMEATAIGLGERGIATLRYQFSLYGKGQQAA